MEAGRVSDFWVRNCSSTRKGSLGTHMHVECKNKGLTSLANVSAPSELGIVSGEFLFHARSVIPAARPPKTAGTDFSKRVFSLLPSSCATVLWCWLKSARAQPGGLDLWADLPLALGSVSGSCSQHEDGASQCGLLWRWCAQTFPLDWAVIHLCFYRTITLEVLQ